MIEGDTDTMLAAANVVLTASGTATVQTALHGTPMVIVYRVSPLTYRLLRRLVTVDNDRDGQSDCRREDRARADSGRLYAGDASAGEAISMLTDEERVSRSARGSRRCGSKLGGPGCEPPRRRSDSEGCDDKTLIPGP